METVRQQITLAAKPEEKTTTTGKTYWKVADANGQEYSIWGDNPAVIGPFVNGEGTVLDVDVETKGRYKNIVAATLVHYRPSARKFNLEERKDRSVCISYAKDLVAAGKVELADLENCALRMLAFITGEDK